MIVWISCPSGTSGSLGQYPAAGRKLHMYVQTGLCEKVCTFEHMNMAVYVLASI